MWVANPLSNDFCIHYNLAGLAGAQEIFSYEEVIRSLILMEEDSDLALLVKRSTFSAMTVTWVVGWSCSAKV